MAPLDDAQGSATLKALSGRGLIHTDSVSDPLRRCRQLKTPVEKDAEANQIGLGRFVEIEGMKRGAQA
jgi:hypothetical protein